MALSQSYVLSLLQPPVAQCPLLLHPAGDPFWVPVAHPAQLISAQIYL